MSDYSKNLGNSIYEARKQLKMTQAVLAERAGVTEQTIRKIEHGEGNPQLDVFCSLIRELQIDPANIVYPKKSLEQPARKKLDLLLSDCTDAQIAALIPILKGALEVVQGKQLNAIK